MLILVECEDPWTETHLSAIMTWRKVWKIFTYLYEFASAEKALTSQCTLLTAEGVFFTIRVVKKHHIHSLSSQNYCEEAFSEISTAEFSVYKMSARFWGFFWVRCDILKMCITRNFQFLKKESLRNCKNRLWSWILNQQGRTSEFNEGLLDISRSVGKPEYTGSDLKINDAMKRKNA